MNDSNHSNAESSLCLACGLCCDGTLFSYVPVREGDSRVSLEGASIKVLLLGEENRFEQPCSAYSRQCCQIYTDRPTNCRKFRCKLLIELLDRKITHLDAREKINQVFFLRNNLIETLPGIAPELHETSLPELWDQWNRLANGEEGLAFRRKHGAALMQMAALRWYLQQHFFKEKNSRANPPNRIDSND